MEILRTRGLEKIYKTGELVVRALDGVDIDISEGEFIAVIGSSGCGKTTLLNMLGGLDYPTTGSVMVRGYELAAMDNDELTVFRRRNIGFVFQNYNLVSVLNVYENIVLPLKLDGVKINKEFVDRIIHSLGLDEKVHQMPNTLSGGQQQRVAIARALVTKPAIVLADEPTGNLDSKTGLEVIGLMKTMAEEYSQIIVIVTHNEEIAQMTDRMIRMEDGRILQEGGMTMELRNNNREVIRELARANYRKNRGRNRVLTLAVALAVFMVFGAFSIARGKMEADYLLYARNDGSVASLSLEDGSEKQYEKIKTLDYVKNTGLEKDFAVWYKGGAPVLGCTVLDNTAFEKLIRPAYTDVTGHYPEEANEVMLPLRGLEQLGIENPHIGMTLDAELRFQENRDAIESSFVLSGYYKDYVNPILNAPVAYFSEKYLESLGIPLFPASYILMEQNGFFADGELMEAKLYEDVSTESVAQQFIGMNSLAFTVVEDFIGSYMVAFLCSVMILGGAFLLIYNVMSITLGNDIRQYGLLKTIGTTGGQIRKIVFCQTGENDSCRMPFRGCCRFFCGEIFASGDAGRIISPRYGKCRRDGCVLSRISGSQCGVRRTDNASGRRDRCQKSGEVQSHRVCPLRGDCICGSQPYLPPSEAHPAAAEQYPAETWKQETLQ